MIAGSSSAATREQVRACRERDPSLKLDRARRRSPTPSPRRPPRALADGAVLVYSTASPEEVARVQEQLGVERASSTVEAALGEIARRLVDAGARTVVVAGGETSGAVVSALGDSGARGRREIATGVPWMTSLARAARSRSRSSRGTSAAPDFFLRAIEAAAT